MVSLERAWEGMRGTLWGGEEGEEEEGENEYNREAPEGKGGKMEKGII